MDYKDKIKKLHSQLIIGTQYYRPPAPLPEDWEDDFKRMKDIGLTMIKFWVYWRWIEYKKGIFDFSYYDKLFELGNKYNIRMHPNLFVESAPQWVFEKYPDCLPVNIHREICHEGSRASTQIGGYMPCFDHEAVRKLAINLIHKVVDRYKKHSELLCWDIWNEISLKSKEVVCACPASTVRYHKWLQKKYKNVETLNKEWKMRYASFSDVIVPTNYANYASYINWQLFSTENTAWHGKWRYRAIKDIDENQVAMVHFGGSPTWTSIVNKPTFKQMKNIVDFLGVSGHNFNGLRHKDYFKNNSALESNYRFLCSLEDYPWASEVSSDMCVMGDYYPAPQLPKEQIAYWTLLPISMGCKSVLYWSFKPEQLGMESPGLGLIKLNGEYTSRAYEVKRICEFLNTEKEFFAYAKPAKQKIGILHYDESAIMSQIVYGSVKNSQNHIVYLDSLNGIYHTLRILNQPACFVYPEDVLSSNLEILYIPLMLLAKRDWVPPFKKFVCKQGGTIICESGLGQYKEGDFFYEKTLPGNGFTDLFGIEEISAVNETFMDSNLPEMFSKKDEFQINYGNSNFMGNFEKRPLRIKTARALAYFKDGQIAVTENKIGKGRAIYIGSNPSIGVWRTESKFPEFLKTLLGINSPYEEIFENIPEKVTIENLEYHNKKMFFLFNHTDKTAEIKLKKDTKLIYSTNPEKDKLVHEYLKISPLSTVVLEN